MQSHPNKVGFQETIKSARNNVVCTPKRETFMKENHCVLRKYEETLQEMKNTAFISNQRTYSANTSSNRIHHVNMALACDHTQDMKTNKILINCPNCANKLGVRVSSSSISHSEGIKLNDPVNFEMFPDERGERIPNDVEHNYARDNLPFILQHITSDKNNVSYTVLKTSSSTPQSKAFDKDNHKNYRATKESKSQIWEKPVGKHIYFHADTNVHPCLTTTRILEQDDTQTRPLLRSRSFTLPSPSILPKWTGGVEAFEPKCCRLPCVQASHTHRQQTENFQSESFHFEDIKVGIDKVDAAPLYDSPSTTSCESDESEADAANSLASQFAPEPHLTSSGIMNSPAFHAKASETEERRQDHETLIKISTEKNNCKSQDVPEFRQDLYKNCFTLFMENWFGKR